VKFFCVPQPKTERKKCQSIFKQHKENPYPRKSISANCAIATPIGYQTSILVMGPGHYRFGDYFRAGAPLIVILWLVFSLFAPWYYGL